jgi:hypothetical protein
LTHEINESISAPVMPFTVLAYVLAVFVISVLLAKWARRLDRAHRAKREGARPSRGGIPPADRREH